MSEGAPRRAAAAPQEYPPEDTSEDRHEAQPTVPVETPSETAPGALTPEQIAEANAGAQRNAEARKRAETETSHAAGGTHTGNQSHGPANDNHGGHGGGGAWGMVRRRGEWTFAAGAMLWWHLTKEWWSRIGEAVGDFFDKMLPKGMAGSARKPANDNKPAAGGPAHH